MKKSILIKKMVFLTSMTLGIFTNSLFAQNEKVQSGYVKGDFHQHSTYTDGSYTIGHVMQKSADFGLDWWANSEHGGAFLNWGSVSGVDLGTSVTWAEAGIPLKGDATNGNMFRWQSLKDWSFRDILLWRRVLSDKLIIQGYEMNVPGHEHGSVGIIGNQFNKENPDVNALAEFEFKFDNSDKDGSGGAAMGWVKSTKTGHEKTLEAISWLQNNYAGQSWLVPAHPERRKSYNISYFRDMNNAGPDVCFGFESMPGHQKDSGRGGYSTGADGGGTYGGCGFYAAKVGGLWDALLSEGRNFWLFASSDFHDIDGDFYPGEYQKTYTYVTQKNDPMALVAGLRSGNSWVVQADLIDMLDFKVSGMGSAVMGGTAKFNKQITVDIIIRDPETNNNFSMNPVLDHVDLIMGKITGKVEPGNTLYNLPEAPETKVIARFDKNGGVTSPDGITSIAWTNIGNGKIMIKYQLKNLNDACYLRLRGTNQGLNILGETDDNGNPVLDFVLGANDSIKAISDLWFYSNPIFAVPSGNNLKSGSIGSESEVNSVIESQNIGIYPNPAHDIIYFTNMKGEGSVDIYSISGSLISKLKITNNAANVSGLKKGVYIARVKNENQVNNLKFEIQ